VLKKIWKEFETKLCPMYGIAGVLVLVWKLCGWNSVFDFVGGFDKSLLLSYIYLTIWYYLSYRILPKYIKNMLDNNKNFGIVQVILTPVLFTLIKIIWNFITNGNINLLALSIFFISTFIFLVITYTIIYLSQKAYYRHVNNKLNEYKQQNDDDKDVKN